MMEGNLGLLVKAAVIKPTHNTAYTSTPANRQARRVGQR